VNLQAAAADLLNPFPQAFPMKSWTKEQQSWKNRENRLLPTAPSALGTLKNQVPLLRIYPLYWPDMLDYSSKF
jgi:hypothetical protein